MHTTCSDWDVKAKDLIDKCKKLWLRAMSITDHDSIAAYTKNNIAHAKDIWIELISWVEISTIDEQNRRYHILWYNFELENSQISQELNRLQRMRIQNTKDILTLLQKHWWEVDFSLIKKEWVISKATIAQSILLEEKNRDRLNQLFKKIPTIGEFIEEWIIPWKKCYVRPDSPISPAQAIKVIQNSWWVSILAHPSEYALKWENIEELLSRMATFWIDWFEAISCVFNRKEWDKIIEHREIISTIAKQKWLIITGWSDFHTENKNFWETIPLGYMGHDRKVLYDVVISIKERSRKYI